MKLGPGETPPRGEAVDIGGRRLRVVRAGPTNGDAPLIVLEAGAFGFSADWAVVQEGLAAAGLRSLAYDRAGLGYSDPGPTPRDGLGILGDLERLLAVLGEGGPFLYCGHSMAGLHARLFAARFGAVLEGAVLVDATTPEILDWKPASGFIGHFATLSRLAARIAGLGLLKPLRRTPLADAIGLPGVAKREKRAAFADPEHNHWAAAEVDAWGRTAAQAREAGPFAPGLPVAVVLTGSRSGRPDWRALRAVPAFASREGLVEYVSGASHATLLSARFAPAIGRAVDAVRARRSAS
ncbi:MAG TPA: alpha/beta hydrolase [Caulobacteraceae bacterium]|nr:alpha/beta hydrolase [Caulobacteraceae bacterium]